MKFIVTAKDFFEDNKDRGVEVVFADAYKKAESSLYSDICKYVCFVWDHYSPFHEMETSTRQRAVLTKLFPKKTEDEKSSWMSYHKTNIGKIKEIFLEFQKRDSTGQDLECKAYFSLCKSLDLLSGKLNDPKTDIEDRLKISKELPKLIKEKRDLEVILKYRLKMLEEEKNLGKEFSRIDKMHNSNRDKILQK
jgi:hypothetical protein